MKRLLLYSMGAVVIVAALFIYLLLRPDVASRLFFGTGPAPVELNLKGLYAVPTADEKTVAIVSAAKDFIGSLDDGQRQAVSYPFTDNAQRSNWSNFPEGMVPRGGLDLGALSDEQRARLDALIGEFLSEEGVKNVMHQLAAEDTLVPEDFGGVMKYGTEYFYVAFLGEPSTTEPWMFQLGGHHLAINATVFGPHVSFSPMLTGGQPLHVSFDGAEVFITERESAAAIAFMDSLTEEQRNRAVRSERLSDMALGPGKFGTPVAPEGISGGELNAAQRTLLQEVIEARLGFMNDDDFAEKMNTVVAEITDTHFGWWGQQGVLGAGYFRITSPSFVIEYASQNGDGTPDHVHSMYREINNDYGAAWIANE